MAVANALTKPDTLTFEIWKQIDGSPVDLVGILYLTGIRSGQDCVGHYVFYDGKLGPKTALLKSIIDWCFTDHCNASH